MPLPADGSVVRTLSALAALAVSYGLGFAATAVLTVPLLGGWGVILAMAGVVVALPFLGIAALVLLAFRRSIARHRLAWCLAATPAVVAAWLAAEYGFEYRHRGFSLPDYLMIRSVIERAVFVGVTAAAASTAFHVTEPRIHARFVRALRERSDSPA